MNKALFNKLYDLIKCELDIQLGDGDYIDSGDKEAATEAIIEILEKEDLINREYDVKDYEDEKEEKEITLKSLAGTHTFTGVERGFLKVNKQFSWDQDKNTIRFELDGQVFEAIENPSDGYRSYMDKLVISNKQVRNKIPETQVMCIYKDKDDYDDCDLLDFIDCRNGKVFLTIGTKHVHDYYPVCIFEYSPEKLSINEKSQQLKNNKMWEI